MKRRLFLLGAASLLAAPAIVRASSLMAIPPTLWKGSIWVMQDLRNGLRPYGDDDIIVALFRPAHDWHNPKAAAIETIMRRGDLDVFDRATTRTKIIARAISARDLLC